MNPTTYLKMIAGTIPDHSQGFIDDGLRLLAQDALGTDQVHFIRSIIPVEGNYHYLALPSASLASEREPVTPLASALPGHPDHQGPGAYVLDIGVYKVAVFYDGISMDLVCNEAELVTDMLQEQDLPVIRVLPTFEAWMFKSSFTRRTALVEEISRKVTWFSLIAGVALGVCYLGLAAVEGWQSSKMSTSGAAAAQALSEAMRDIKVTSPLVKQLAEYQYRSSVAVRAGGWMDAYSYRNGVESFRIFAPTWITPDYMKSLGDDVIADRDPDNERLIILVKGEPDGKNISSTTVGGGQGVDVPAEPPVQAQ